MATTFRVTMTGQKQVRRMLQQVAPAAAKRAMRSALNKGGSVTLRTMRKLVPVQRVRRAGFGAPGAALAKPKKDRPRGGNLKRSLGRKYLYYPGSAMHLLLLGPRVSGEHKGQHGHLVEAGTRPRTQKTTGRYTGIMPAIRFMERSMDATVFRVIGVIGTEFANGLMREIRRQRGR